MSERPRRRRSSVLLVVAIAAGLLTIAQPASAASLTTQDLSTLTKEQLASALVGSGVTVSNVQYTGATVAAGAFAGGGTGASATIGFDQGVILSSGDVANVIDQNIDDAITTENGLPGNAFLDSLLPAGQSSEDASVLSFDFVPNASSISFHYVFSSDEYNEFVGQGFNDVFGFFVNEQNCATIGQPAVPVSVDTINNGNPYGNSDPNLGAVPSHPELFRNNDPSDVNPPPIDTEMDGLTTVLTCNAPVNANVTNHMTLAIGDVGDDAYDSNVFIEAGSLTTEPPGDVPGAPTDVNADPGDGSAIVTWTPPADDGGSPIDSYTATCTAVGQPDDTHFTIVGGTATSATVGGLTNGVAYTCSVTAHNVNGGSEPTPPSEQVVPVPQEQPQFSATINTGVGGVLLIDPQGADNLGTTGNIKITPQPGPATDVVVTATLFGTPGEVDATCGGNICIGQGIEWSVSDPAAIKTMRIRFFESHKLTHGGLAEDAVAYKDGIAVPDCGPPIPHQGPAKPCVVWRYTTPCKNWQVTLLVDGDDPKGRV